MPFEIVRNDIANMRVDAIVNTTNPQPEIGSGVDSSIHKKAGPRLLEARKDLGHIRVGSAAMTPGFNLAARHVIHTVTPVWQGGWHLEPLLLKRCYRRCLRLAKIAGCRSVAFPLMAAGNHGFPKDMALQIALDAFRDFLEKNEMQIYLVVFSRDAYRLSEERMQKVTSFIDDNYVDQANLQGYGAGDMHTLRRNQTSAILSEQEAWTQAVTGSFDSEFEAAPADFGLFTSDEDLFEGEYSAAPPEHLPRPCAPAPMEESCAAPEKMHRKAAMPSLSTAAPGPRKASLKQLLEETDAGFSETLLKLIDNTGKKDSEIYTKANVTRQHFSKIRNNPGYKPTKATAIAFAIALELDLEQTRDLIGRAGYALTKSSKFDVIIMYFIQEKNYDLFDINAALFEFDQSLLGA